jgi:hypothetical protein
MIYLLCSKSRRGHDHIVIGFTTTYDQVNTPMQLNNDQYEGILVCVM